MACQVCKRDAWDGTARQCFHACLAFPCSGPEHWDEFERLHPPNMVVDAQQPGSQSPASSPTGLQTGNKAGEPPAADNSAPPASSTDSQQTPSAPGPSITGKAAARSPSPPSPLLTTWTRLPPETPPFRNASQDAFQEAKSQFLRQQTVEGYDCQQALQDLKALPHGELEDGVDMVLTELQFWGQRGEKQVGRCKPAPDASWPAKCLE